MQQKFKKSPYKEYKSEAHLQAAAFKWLNATHLEASKRFFLWYNNPPNGAVAAMLKSMGLKRGPADSLYFSQKEGLVFIEAKLPGQVQTKQQEDFQVLAQEMGFKYLIYSTLQEFQNIMLKII